MPANGVTFTMADSAERRVRAISNQLAPASQSSGTGLPAVVQVASKGPRLAGKVAIITGTERHPFIHPSIHQMHQRDSGREYSLAL